MGVALANLGPAGDVDWMVDVRPGASTLLVAFAGIGPRDRPPTFSFLRAVGELHASAVFVRDPHRAWYHHGVPGLGGSIDAVAARLRRLADAANARRVITLGTSVGGYAAILFGRLIDADLAIAFAPPTFLGASMRFRTRNGRYLREWLALRRSRGFSRRHADLRRVLGEHRSVPLPVHVHYAAGDRIDAAYARRLAGVPGVALRPHAGAGHDLVRRLRANGELAGLLAELAPQPRRATS